MDSKSSRRPVLSCDWCYPDIVYIASHLETDLNVSSSRTCSFKSVEQWLSGLEITVAECLILFNKFCCKRELVLTQPTEIVIAERYSQLKYLFVVGRQKMKFEIWQITS